MCALDALESMFFVSDSVFNSGFVSVGRGGSESFLEHQRGPRFIGRRPRLARKGWEFSVSTPCPQFDSKEMTMTPTEWLILIITTSVVVIVFGVWFYRLTH
jgi:hypothetical protein